MHDQGIYVLIWYKILEKSRFCVFTITMMSWTPVLIQFLLGNDYWVIPIPYTMAYVPIFDVSAAITVGAVIWFAFEFLSWAPTRERRAEKMREANQRQNARRRDNFLDR